MKEKIQEKINRLSGWVFGAGGNDHIVMEAGSNAVHGGAGIDVITLGDGDDKVFT